MPFVPAWKRKVTGGGPVGGRAPMGGRSASGTGGILQTAQLTNARAAAPAKPSYGLTSGRVIGTDNFGSLGASVQQGGTLPLPTVHDITGLVLTLTTSAVTGSGSVTLDYANQIDHIVIRNRNGNAFDTIQVADYAAAGGLNPPIYDLNTLFDYPTPTAAGKTQVAASTAVAATKTIHINGLRLSAVDGPWTAELFYNSVTGAFGTGVTVASTKTLLRVKFGDTVGPDGLKYNTKIQTQNIPTTGTGDFHLETFGIVRNTRINDILFQNIATLTDLDHVVINSHGANIDTNLTQAAIVDVMTERYNNAFQAKTLVPTAAVNTQFTMGENDETVMNWGTSESNIRLTYIYLLPAGDAY